MELYQLNNNQGFSLLEVIFMLTVLSIIISLSAPLIFSTLDKQTEKQFFDVLFSDLLLIQTASHGINDTNASIVFNESSYSVRILEETDRVMTRSYPSGWKTDERAFKRISFKNGTIRQAGTIFLQNEENGYRIVFPLGKGRGYVDKQ